MCLLITDDVRRTCRLQLQSAAVWPWLLPAALLLPCLIAADTVRRDLSSHCWAADGWEKAPSSLFPPCLPYLHSPRRGCRALAWFQAINLVIAPLATRHMVNLATTRAPCSCDLINTQRVSLVSCAWVCELEHCNTAVGLFNFCYSLKPNSSCLWRSGNMYFVYRKSLATMKRTRRQQNGKIMHKNSLILQHNRWSKVVPSVVLWDLYAK